MLERYRKLGVWLLFVCFAALLALPLLTLISFIFFEYNRQRASYVFVGVRLSDLWAFFRQPEISVFTHLIRQSLSYSILVFAYSFCLSFAFLLARKLREITIIGLLLSLCFIVPAILKSYAWSKVLSALPLWDYFALPAFLAISLSVFYFSAIATRINSLGQNVLISLDEYYKPPRLVLELLRFCIGPSVFAAVCIFSVVIFSGIEVEHLGRNVLTFGDVVGGFFGGREREAGFLSLVSAIFIGAMAYGAVQLIWERNR